MLFQKSFRTFIRAINEQQGFKYFLLFVHRYKNIKIYGIIISLSVLHGCETCTIASREKHMMKILQNRAPRKLFPPKMEEI